MRNQLKKSDMQRLTKTMGLNNESNNAFSIEALGDVALI
jgi:hypothetical protein